MHKPENLVWEKQILGHFEVEVINSFANQLPGASHWALYCVTIALQLLRVTMLLGQ